MTNGGMHELLYVCNMTFFFKNLARSAIVLFGNGTLYICTGMRLPSLPVSTL